MNKIYLVQNYRTYMTQSAWRFSFTAEEECKRLDPHLTHNDGFVVEEYEIKDVDADRKVIISSIKKSIRQLNKQKLLKGEKEERIKALNEQLDEVENSITQENYNERI